MEPIEKASESPAEPAAVPSEPEPKRKSRPLNYGAVAFAVSLVAVVLAGWQWFDAHRAIRGMELDVARKLSDIEAMARDTRALAGQSRDGLRDAEARLGQLEARVVESQSHRLALESLYQELSRSRDEWTIAEIEQALLIATQQLQLAGNVKAALIALEAADARLARIDRPRMVALRRIINRDIDRLRGVPQVDVIGMALRLDTIAGRVESLPLVMTGRPAATAPGSEDPGAGTLKRAWREFVADLRNLIRIQRIDRDEIPLLSPDQSLFLRENLRIRLLGARLALLARDEASFRADLKSASEWLSRYFDTNDKEVAGAQSTLVQLQRTDVGILLPDISASLDAVHTLKPGRERGLR